VILERAEYDQYIRTHLGLLYFVGLKERVIPAKATFDDFLSYDFTRKFRCREALYRRIEVLDEYINKSMGKLSTADLLILNNFHKSIRGEFIILKCLSKHAIFIDTQDNSFYAVKALADPFQAFFDTFPAMCKTTLVPFGNKIIYDGFVEKYNIILGPEIRRSLEGDYKEAKAKKAIITEVV
jgi:hypothetical protein